VSRDTVEIVSGRRDADRWLLTTAIGGDYFVNWHQRIKPFWDDYAVRHGLGIAVVVGDLFTSEEPELNGSWQKMLAPRALRATLGREVRCALLDTDLVISPGAADVFRVVEPGSIGVVSQEHGLPLEVTRLHNRIALLRQRFVDPGFPLSSILNATPRQVFEWAGLEPVDDYFCAGMFVVDTANHGELLADWYRSAPQEDAYHDIGAWEEVWLNHCVQARDDVTWLDYSWHALWIYEVAALYPFLYAEECPREVKQWCLAASLMRNNFVHLAGRWESGLLGGAGPAFPQVDDFRLFAHQLSVHQETPTTAVMRGTILPPTA
jgi:hypothetical protein